METFSKPSGTANGSGPPEIMDIEIVGEADAAERARLLALGLLDELFGLSVMQVAVASKLHPIIAGRKREELNHIMQQTRTNFYSPIPFVVQPQSAGNGPESADSYHNTIYITGQPDDIQEASKRYLALAHSIESKIITKQISCLHRKLDWLYSFRKEKIRKIMADNAVDITFPICDCYLASIQASNPVESAEQFLRFTHDMSATLTRINGTTGAEIIINRNIVEIYGSDVQSKQAYQDITSAKNDVLKIRDTKFQIELSQEHRDFINGKKNGKINRITKTSGCRIAFQDNPSDVNMMIDLYSAIPSCLLVGISMLEEELPAEMSFHIPETYHKRIIGVGGKNIQKIMKRFGVYVKFSNLEEYEQLGGYYENADNVICRTPSKNAENLRDLKASIVEAVNATDLLETLTAIDHLPRQLSQWYCGLDTDLIQKITLDHRVRVYLPDKESGLDSIGLEGPESSLGIVKEKLKNSIPFISDFQVPGTPAVANLLKTPDFSLLKQKLRKEFEIVVWIAVSPPDTEYDFSFFLLHPARVTQDQYEEAKQHIVALFNEHKVPFTHVSRSESYANLNTQVHYDSFQHFNSKLLAPVGGSNTGASSTGVDPSLRQQGSSFGSMFGAGSAPSSVQNIRQLFDDTSSSAIPAGPPGLQRSGSDLRPKANSVIARPGAPSNLVGRAVTDV
ncbi:hypothetical protein HDU91_007009 [Kappamyces sp. JEL0680]|nr:hypothetical protein HDU91_007009 [Kappamyces sp. JEL0680]